MSTETLAVVGDVIQLTRGRMFYDNLCPVGTIGIVETIDDEGAMVKVIGATLNSYIFPHYNDYQIVWTDR